MKKNKVGRRAYSEKEKDLIKEKIINSAQQLFSEYEFNKVTMQKIADRAEMAKASLYYYFKSIFDIYIVIATKIYQETYIFYNKYLEGKTSPKEKFIELYRSKFNFFKNKIEYLVITNLLYIDEYKFDYDKVLPEHLDKFFDVINGGNDILIKILNDGVKSGDFRKDLNINHIYHEFAYTSRSILNRTILNFKDVSLKDKEIFYEEFINNCLRILK